MTAFSIFEEKLSICKKSQFEIFYKAETRSIVKEKQATTDGLGLTF